MFHERKTYRNEIIALDNQRFVHCHFERCTLVYSATGPVHLEGNSFDTCSWKLDGAAIATIQHLNFIWNIVGLRPIAEQAINLIKTIGTIMT